MAYIKIKKIWLNKFSTEDAEEIFKIFKENSPVPIKDWSKNNLVDMIAQHGQFIHPETDKYDDTEGISPKQILMLSEKIGENYLVFLKNMISILNENKEKFSGYISDGFISWNRVFDDFVIKHITSNGSIWYKLGLLKITFSDKVLAKFTAIENKLIEKIGRNDIQISNIEEAIREGLVPEGNTLTLEMIDLENFLNGRKTVWKEARGFVPQSDYMLRVNPNNFDTMLLSKIEDVYGSRQIGKLDKEIQSHLSLLIDNFGINLMKLPVSFFKPQAFNLKYSNEDVRDCLNVIDKLMRYDAKFSMNSFLHLVKTLAVYEKFEKFILNINELCENDLEVINYIINIVSMNKFNTNINHIDPQHFRTLYRYRVTDIKEIKFLVNLYEANRNNKCSLPNLKGSVGAYSWEITTKDNPIGLILGYATDCCQVYNHNGESCLVSGYKDEDSSFFVVTKNDKIYAQSWCWSKKDTSFGKGFCFDSIEVLGKDLSKSKSILNCYKDAAKQLEQYYDVVYCGADGNSMPNGIEQINKKISVQKVYDLKLDCPFNVYSDLTNDQELGGAIIFGKEKI